MLYILRHYQSNTKAINWSPALRNDILKNHRAKFVKYFAPLCCLLALLDMKSLSGWAKETKHDLGGEAGRQLAISEIRKALEKELKNRMIKKIKPPKDFKLVADAFLNHKVANLKAYVHFGGI